jgi:hypothetical protein
MPMTSRVARIESLGSPLVMCRHDAVGGGHQQAEGHPDEDHAGGDADVALDAAGEDVDVGAGRRDESRLAGGLEGLVDGVLDGVAGALVVDGVLDERLDEDAGEDEGEEAGDRTGECAGAENPAIGES